METYIVTAPKLNIRTMVPQTLSDEANIIGEVKRGYSFLGEEVSDVPNPSLGKWYRDRDGYYYWGGGLIQSKTPALISPVLDAGKKDWGFMEFNIEKLWSHSTGEGASIAIVDTGLNSNLPDFLNRKNIQYYNAVTGSPKREDCMDDNSMHGTDCTSIVGAQGETLWGVAPECSLLIIKTTDDQGQQPMDAILEGLDKAIAEGTDVISLSFGMSVTPQNQPIVDTMHEKIKKAYANNQTIVAAVGDSGELPFPATRYPASFPECISVGAINKQRIRTRISSKSEFLDLMGPGEDIFSISHPGRIVTGTSFSTPFVGSVVLLLKAIARARGRSLSNIELYDILKRSAFRNFSGYSALEYGWGILNPVEALKFLL